MLRYVSLAFTVAVLSVAVVGCGTNTPVPGPTTPSLLPSATSTPGATPASSPLPTSVPTSTGVPPTPSLKPSPTATPAAPTGKVEVRVAPDSASVSRGSSFKLTVQVNPGGLGISAGELTLKYDPQALSIVGATPGPLLGANPIVGSQRVDAAAGTLLYALARVGTTVVPTPAGVFAMVEFRVLDTAQPGNYSLTLVKSGLADEKFKDITQVAVFGATVTVK